MILIIGILSGTAVNVYRNARHQYVFKQSILEVTELIKTARNYALTSRAVYDSAGKKYIPTEGYGVYIKRNNTLGTSKFILFANIKATEDRQIKRYNGSAYELDEEVYLLAETTNFPANAMEYTYISANGVLLDGTTDKAVIIFKPPVAETFIGTNPTLAGDVMKPENIVQTLTLKLSNTASPAGTAPIEISINKIAGLPEVKLPGT